MPGVFSRPRSCFAFMVLIAAGCATIDREAQAPSAEGAEQRQKALVVAHASYEAGRYSDALAEYLRVIEVDPHDDAARLGVADCYVAAGATRDASPLYDALLDSPDLQIRLGARQGRGVSLLMLGDAEAGHAHLLEAVTEDPSLWRSWNALGWYYDRRRNWEAADEAYGRATSLSPTPHIVQNNWGMSLLARGNAAGAAVKFRRALEIVPEFEVAKTNLQLSLGMQGRYREALAGTDERSMPTALNNVGYAAMLRGDKNEAEKLLSRAVEDSPRFNVAASKNLKYLMEASTR